MHKGCIKPAYNYPMYLSQRKHDTKIKKKNMYSLLDDPGKVLDTALHYEKKHREAEAFLANMWGE